MKHKIIIAGAGGIGRAVGLLLANSKVLNAQLFIGDLYISAAEESCAWIEDGLSKAVDVQAFAMPESGTSPAMDQIFAGGRYCIGLLTWQPGATNCPYGSAA